MAVFSFPMYLSHPTCSKALAGPNEEGGERRGHRHNAHPSYLLVGGSTATRGPWYCTAPAPAAARVGVEERADQGELQGIIVLAG